MRHAIAAAAVVTLLVGSALASHNPDRPTDYKDERYTDALADCSKERKKWQKHMAKQGGSAQAQELNAEHIQRKYEKCRDRAKKKAKRRHGLK